MIMLHQPLYDSVLLLSYLVLTPRVFQEIRGAVTKDRLRMGSPSAPLESRVMASDTSYTIPQPSGTIPVSTATRDPLVGDTVPPPEYHT